MKVIFAGTPDFSVPCLQALIKSKHEVIAVYTQPDRPSGRGRKLTPSPVKQVALAHNLPVFQPKSLKKLEEQQQLAALNADVMVVIAYGLILPLPVLNAPRLGCINVHASLLPRWRGASPIQQVLLNGEKETGVTIMQMDEGLDTGAMLNTATCHVDEQSSSQQLHDELAQLGVSPLLQTLDELEQGSIKPVKQDDSKATYAAKISKQEGEILWTDSAENIHNKVRAFNPWPIAYTSIGDQTLRVHRSVVLNTEHKSIPGEIIATSKEGIEVACGQGSLLLTQMQFPGAKALSAKELLNAKRDLFQPGLVLGR